MDEDLVLTREENALDYLERAVVFLRETTADVAAWKWVCLALYGALSGFALCACHTGRYPDITVGGKGKKTIGFAEALRLCQDQSRMSMTVDGRALRLSEPQKRAISVIGEGSRHVFEHFEPIVFSLEPLLLREVIPDALDVIEFLALRTNTYVTLEEDEERRALAALAEMRSGIACEASR